MTQSEALNILKTGKNVFVTGPAGSGKTYVINEYIKYLREHNIPVGITASTGIAATHMGGMTIHSWSGMGIKDTMDTHDMAELAEKSQYSKRFKETQVLIIDEVSMLHHYRFDLLDKLARYVRSARKLFDKPTSEDVTNLSELPFGGMQLVLCGDFFQLPPVSRYGEPEARFIYTSEAWKNAGFTVCYLSEQFRQTDDMSLSILNEIRSGEVSEEARENLKSRYVPLVIPAQAGIQRQGIKSITIDSSIPEVGSDSGSEIVLDISEQTLDSRLRGDDTKEAQPRSFESEPTRLYTHNIDVDQVNERELKKVNEVEIIYEMTSRGKKPLVDALKKSCLAPEKLRLRKGARVMCVKNNFEEGYVNGTLGVIVSCGHDVDPVIQTNKGHRITIEKASWTIEENGKVLAEINQYPLRLAWAITVHKSQGMSLDAIEVDLSKSFEPGMGYVALSRMRTFGGLSILGMNENALKVHPEVLEYDRHLKELSNKAESVLEHTDKREIQRAQEEFLAKVAPLHRMGGSKKGKYDPLTGKYNREPARKISTYFYTAELVREEKSLNEIAKTRDITVETVISHIEKLLIAKNDDVGEGESLDMRDVYYLKKEISHGHFSKIEDALEVVSAKQNDDKPPLLSPIKSIVGTNVSFNEIRLARLLLGYVK